MRVAIMQPYFFPYIGYWQLINSVDNFIIYDDVNYIKKGWINRNNILNLNDIYSLVLPIQKASQNKLINELYIDENQSSTDKILKNINNFYKKAPFFEEVYPVVQKIFLYPEKKLSSFLENEIILLCDYLHIKTNIMLSSNIDKDLSLRSENKIIDICKTLKAKVYVNAIGGKELYDFDKFKDNEIELKFLKTNNVIYQQFNNEFIPNLSIIDVMMFNSSEKINTFLNDYSLV